MNSGVELRVLCDSCLFRFAFELRFTRFPGYCLQAMDPSGIACKQAPTFRKIRLNVIANLNNRTLNRPPPDGPHGPGAKPSSVPPWA